VDELAGRNGIALSDAADLTFPYRMHCLVSLDGSTRAVHRSEPEACRDQPMVLLDDVVQVGRCSATTMPSEFAGLL
jgi:hypothetical protein